MAGAGVTSHIVQGLLGDTEQYGIRFHQRIDRVTVRDEVNRETTMLAPFVAQVLQGTGQTQIIQNRRAQAVRDMADLAQQIIHLVDHPFKRHTRRSVLTR